MTSDQVRLSRRLFGVGAMGLGAASLAGCKAVVGYDPITSTLDIANQAEPLSLDPHKAQGIWENNIIGNMFLGLTTEDAKANISPGMAESWTTSPDGLTWTFKLRNATWSDGHPCTAYDFEFGIRRIMSPKTLSQYAEVLYMIRNAKAVKEEKLPPEAVGVRALDEKTLEITLEFAAPYLPGLLRHYTAYPIPKHAVEKFGDAWIRPENFVGNGAYVLKKWWSNYIVHLAKNPAFYDAANVDIRNLYFYPTQNEDAAARRVMRREVGWSSSFPGAKQEVYQRDLPGFVRTHPWQLINYLSLNMRAAPFDNAKARRALSMAIDRKFLCDKVWKAGYVPAYSMVVPGTAGHKMGAQLPFRDIPQEERLGMARALLEEAGYGPNNPLEFEFKHRNSRENPDIARTVAAQWRAIAPWVKVELRGQETQIHYQDLRAKAFEAGDGGWIADFNDPRAYLYLFLSSTKGMNYSGFNDPAYDDLMARSDRELNIDARADLMLKAEQLLMEADGIVPLAFGSSRNLVDPRLKGWEDNVEDIHRARYMKFDKA
jgi:oligopeptide transport system substrate-binding protein